MMRAQTTTNESLHPRAWVVLALNALYTTADGLCSVFVGVYFWVQSLSFATVCWHYIAVFAVTPVVYLATGWLAQRFDRVHVYRIGLLLNAAFYGALLWLAEDASDYAVHLGVLLGVTWGFFWQGNNVFSYDVLHTGRRDLYFGLLNATNGVARLLAPLLGGTLIALAEGEQTGYQYVFGASVLLYLVAVVLSAGAPGETARRAYHLGRALWPGRDQRDWRLFMWSSLSLAGTFNIFVFLLALLMYIETDDAFQVGGYAALQGLASILTSFWLGRWLTPRRRQTAMLLGVVIMFGAGLLMLIGLNVWTLLVFGVLRATAMPLTNIPYMAVRYEVIRDTITHPAERIEYLSAWEVPLAAGRLLMMGILLVLAETLAQNEWGIRITLFVLCASRVLTYWLVTQTSVMRAARC